MANRPMNDYRKTVYPRSDGEKTACLDVGRVFDSCSDRDCMENLRVYFTADAQHVIDNAACVRAKKAKVVHVTADLEEMPFKEGCFTCKLTFYVEIRFDVFSNASQDCCTSVCGLVWMDKSVVLYGGEGNVQVFTGEYTGACGCHLEMEGGGMPRCRVQVAEPVVLEADLTEACGCRCANHCGCNNIPLCVASRFGSDLAEVTSGKTVVVSLGVFSVVQMIRDVQLVLPYYGDCVPCEECNCDEETPCEMFRKMSFPIDEFFPKPCKGTHK